MASKGYNELFAKLKKSAKKANMRMLRLEKRGVKTPAYSITQNDIKNILHRDNNRFRSNKKMTYGEMERELKYVNKFLNSVSSTVTGLRTSVEKRNTTLMKKFSTNINVVNDLYKLFESDNYKHLAELMPSDIVISEITDALEKGKKVEDIHSAILDALSSESDIDLYNNFVDYLNDD